MKLLSKLDPRRLNGKTVLLRIDLNVEPGMPIDSYRVAGVLPTIKLLRKAGATVVILSHRGRPTLPPDKKRTGRSADWTQFSENRGLSLRPFATLLSTKLSSPVRFLAYEEMHSHKLREQVRIKGGVVLFENLRFHPGEERDDAKFAKFLAKLGDLYVNDAFAVSHRANASVHALTKLLPSYAGLRLERELAALAAVLGRVVHPVTLIIGGAKVADKIGMVERFGKTADHILLAGGPANTFFSASKLPVGDSVVDVESLPFAKKNLKNPKVVLPVDVKVHARRILDVGERTVALFAEIVERSGTIVWNGPLGLFEQRTYAHGTMGLWQAIARNRKAVTVVGGGETIASLALVPDLKLPQNVFLSTGGGAMLEFLAGKKLPGIQALK
ncbi:MAG: phosphoglycerate kinase [bacterium]|nr:phosphoglycerate kinase [bacterium]